MVKKTEPCTDLQSNSNEQEISVIALTSIKEEKTKPTLLLHSCCGPCSSAVIERLAPDYNITVFFYNPNVTDKDEYEKRKLNQIKFIDGFNRMNKLCEPITLIEGEYQPEEFFKLTSGYSNEPEGGKRCTICFEMRLRRTAETAKETGKQLFGTTLTVSPHKDYILITSIGTKLAEEFEIEFLDKDFKKKGGFQRSIQLSKEYNLYRQNYCGCEYSKR